MNDVPKAPAQAVAAAAFDAAAWREQLLELNPWARGLTIDEDDEAFLAARQKATLKRHAEGKEIWNTWANGMLALKKAIQEAEGWPTDRRSEGENADTQLWLALATSAFSTLGRRHTFQGNARFDESVFAGPAWFAGATFSAGAWFEGATFSADASFGGATFSAGAWFRGATFSTVAWFPGATFSATASFAGATFFDAASFNGATFAGATLMNDVRFGGGAHLAQARFKGPMRLDGSVFEAGARFEAVDSEAAFSLAGVTFRRHVPSFIGATFKGTLRLDNVVTPRYRVTFGWTPDRNASAHFRELKRRAEEAHDRDRGLEFSAQEIRTGRFHAGALVPTWRQAAPEGTAQRRVFSRVPLPTWERVALPSWLPKVWSWRFWFGLAYGGFANFGRSLLRPLVVWLALFLGFAVFYLGQHEGQHIARKVMKPDGGWARIGAYVATAGTAWANPPKCTSPGDKLVATTNMVNEALFLSASNALVVFNLGRGDASRRTYGCLYGFEHGGPQAPPIVPYRVAVASTLQTLASAVLIFLFLLAVRNLLRLK